MAKWARKNEDGKIIEIIDFDPSGKFHESIVWEQVSDDTTINDINDLDPDNNPGTLEARAKHEELKSLFNQEPNLDIEI